MRPSSSLRFYAFTTAVFLLILIIGLTFRHSIPQPSVLLGATSSHDEHHDDTKDSSPPAHTPAPSQGTAQPLLPAGKLNEWDPSQYDDVEYPELEDWPGPGEDGLYGDISDLLTEEQHRASNINQRMARQRIKSKLTSNGKYLKVDWLGHHEGYNPSIIPHPRNNGTWIVIGQRDKSRDDNTLFSQELYCEAEIVGNSLRCNESPLMLPIASTTSPHCAEMSWFDSNVGPHDGRMFHGKDRPYIMYNQQSQYNCVGMWINDARRLVDYGGDVPTNSSGLFFWPTNLAKAGGDYGWIEKNWFPFWDTNGELYLHYDFTPRRLLAKLNPDGTVGEDLSEASHEHDSACLEKVLPKLQDTGLEFWHQATNALEVTNCKRSDPDCHATDDNTYVFTIIQTKTFYEHGQYEPYFILFNRTAPFEIAGVSRIPFWYHGKGTAFGNWRVETYKPRDQAQMVFTTSMSWQSVDQTYNGFLDDELMIAFGIEDKHGGVIDVTVGDLIADVQFCSNIVTDDIPQL